MSRNRVDAAISESCELGQELREQYARRLTALDKKEDYYLDLASEEGWPKDKLRAKIAAIRTERGSIQASLEAAEHQLETGRAVFYQALELLGSPQAMYEQGNETVRSILNQAFFTKLFVDGRKVTGQELREPFDVLLGACEVWYRREQVPGPRLLPA